MCPPISLIVRAVKHLIACKGVGTLIVPEWPSANFWPFVSPATGVIKHLIKDWCVVPRCNPVFIPGRGQSMNVCKKNVFFKIPFL